MTGALSPSPTFRRHQFWPLALFAIAAIPLFFIGAKAVAASRNIVFWDEFGTALDLILRLNAGASWNEIIGRFFELSNEHRMFTSRLLFAVSYWLTGTVNFHVIGAIGNLFILGACAVLITTARTTERRVRLAVLLGFGVFQLENFENFLWSGASIDHFQVVFLAIAAIASVIRGTRPALLGGVLLALLATFTLAHGCVAWVVGALVLLQQRRWSHLALWSGFATASLLFFFIGFEFNPGHHIAGISLARIQHVATYWLTLLGGPLTFGQATAATPALGALLLVIVGALGFGGAARREPVVFHAALFAILSLGLVAFGRTEVSDGQILSRYMILGTLAWSLAAFMVLELVTAPARPYLAVSCCLPVLVLFNISANRSFAPLAEGFAEARDRAALRFKQYGEVDGHGQVRLHPIAGYAQTLLQQARDQGVYTLPALCEPRTFPHALASKRIVAHVDEKTICAKSVYLGGWAMIPDTLSKRGQIHVILLSKKTKRIYSTITVQRPDVAKAYNEPRWRLSGFRFVMDRKDIPDEDFQIGLLIANNEGGTYTMTDQWLRLTDPESEPWVSNDSE
jgi:hypothetical protein